MVTLCFMNHMVTIEYYGCVTYAYKNNDVANNVMLHLVPKHTRYIHFFLDNDKIKCIRPSAPMTKRDGVGDGGWSGGCASLKSQLVVLYIPNEEESQQGNLVQHSL